MCVVCVAGWGLLVARLLWCMCCEFGGMEGAWGWGDVESACDLSYVCVHLCHMLGELSMCCVLCCGWGYDCGMFVCLSSWCMSGGYALYAVPCFGRRRCFCAGGGLLLGRVVVWVPVWGRGWYCRIRCAASLRIQ